MSRPVCKALPGCIHCLDFDDRIRVLSEETFVLDASEDGAFSSSSSSSSEEEMMMHEYHRRRSTTATASGTSRRQLYASILPNRASIPEGKATGECQVGWENKQCTTFSTNSARSLKSGCFFNRFASLVVLGVILCWLV